ncbi:MAG: DUF4062 domain-containing protein [Bacteroidetes bacterium]|nr:DUF4062 domain-containing protein [Bacteroidota bacterium]
MKDKKLQVFVSSTYLDLKEERQAAVEAILSSGNIPAGMELFSAGDESQMTVIERWIDESDVYLLILGGRYGSVEKKSGKSYTHLEYEYALNKGKPLFAVVISEAALENKIKMVGSLVIERENQSGLNDFRSLVLGNLVKFWEDKKDIKLAIHETLADFNYRKGLIGWIRGDNAVNTGLLAEEIARLTNENATLRNKLSGLESKNDISYANLSYKEMKSLLESNAAKEDVSGEANLFKYITLYGGQMAMSRHIKSYKDPDCLMLVELKLAKIKRLSGNGYECNFIFTKVGHNFYLRSLLEELDE